MRTSSILIGVKSAGAMSQRTSSTVRIVRSALKDMIIIARGPVSVSERGMLFSFIRLCFPPCFSCAIVLLLLLYILRKMNEIFGF